MSSKPLARDRRVITFDHRGHGDSPNTGDAPTYTFDQLVADMSSLVDRLGLDRFDLLGHSMGGVVAMRYALRHPERVRSLVLMDTAGRAMGGASDFMRGGIELVRAQGTRAVYDVVQPFLGTGERADVMRDRMRTKLEQMDPVAFVALGEELLSYPSVLDAAGDGRHPDHGGRRRERHRPATGRRRARRDGAGRGARRRARCRALTAGREPRRLARCNREPPRPKPSHRRLRKQETPMAHSRDEVQAALDRYISVRDGINAGRGTWADLAQFFTDDAVFIDPAWGRVEGIEEMKATVFGDRRWSASRSGSSRPSSP